MCWKSAHKESEREGHINIFAYIYIYTYIISQKENQLPEETVERFLCRRLFAYKTRPIHIYIERETEREREREREEEEESVFSRTLEKVWDSTLPFMHEVACIQNQPPEEAVPKAKFNQVN
jgi:hypothetical protein